jgi:lipopolysaccharide exporter
VSDAGDPNLQWRLRVGAAWMLSFKLVDRSLGFVGTLVLARVLVPADFGIVAMAVSVIALVELFSAFGFEVALIRGDRAEVDRNRYDSAWTLNVLLGFGICAALLLLAPVAAAYFREPALRWALPVLALGPLIQGFENIGVVAFRRELRFGAEFSYMLSKRIAGLVCVIPLALTLRSWWALIIGTVVGRVVGLVVSYYAHPYRPRFSLHSWRHLVHFSKWVVMVNALAFFLQRTADLIVGRMAGATALGLYSVSMELGNLPTTELIAPINRAVYPVYARVKDNLLELKRAYLGVMSSVALLGIPAAVGVSATAVFSVPALLGRKWLDAIPLIELFGFYGITQVLTTNVYSVYLAIGKPRLQFVVHCVHLTMLAIGLVLLTPRGGAHGAAMAVLVASALVLPVNLAIVFRQLGVKVSDFGVLLWRPVLGAATLFGIIRVLFSHHPLPTTAESVYHLIGAIGVGTATYAAVVFALWRLSGSPPGPEAWTLLKIKALLGRLPGWRARPT